jgi:hypothetical protein
MLTAAIAGPSISFETFGTMVFLPVSGQQYDCLVIRCTEDRNACREFHHACVSILNSLTLSKI